MAVITWDDVGSRFYESGLDRAVLYPENSPGVPWNGLISVTESKVAKTESVFYDGTKVNEFTLPGDFKGNITAYTYPDEFLDCEGFYEDDVGVFLGNQPHKRFGLCYRTKIDSDTESDQHYKLHILYNLTAIPANRNRRTLSLTASASTFQWEISAIPESITGFRPTAQIILDSRILDPWLLADIEDILYGSDTLTPSLPKMQALLTYIRKWDRLIIRDNADGTWTAISQNDADITMVSETEFSIEAENVVWIDANTYEVSSTDKNLEDIV